jgi:hypothetical protein
LNRTLVTSLSSAPSILRDGRGRVVSFLRSETAALTATLAIVFLVYVPTLNDYFHGDDFLAFIDLTTLKPWQQIGDVFTFNDSNVYWRPLGHLFYLGLYEAVGLDPFYFHLAALAVFIATLALLYRFCVGFGLTPLVGLGAVAVCGLVPNHVASVAWVTNAPRLLAVLFALLSLVMLQQSLKTGRRWYEAASFLAMALAVLSDEVAVALTPLPVLYALLAQPRPLALWRQHALRILPYAALGITVGVLQFTAGSIQQTVAPVVISLDEIGLGWHVFREYWALISKLVLPISDGVTLGSILEVQWAAGAIAAACGLVGLALGSWRAWFLVGWLIAALTPFTLWEAPIAPARYVYMAAIPFSVLLSWFVVAALRAICYSHLLQKAQQAGFAPVGYALVTAAVVGALALSARETIERNDAFARTAEPYRALAEDLPRVLPAVAPGSRFVIYYGVWDGSVVWQDAVVRTIYKDRTLSTLNIDSARTNSNVIRPQPKDVVLFYSERGFFLPSLPARTLTTTLTTPGSAVSPE